MVADSTSERTATAVLSLVPPQPDQRGRACELPATGLALRPAPRVRRFLSVAAQHGLAPDDAIRLALEHYLALVDLQALRMEEGALRATLGAVATRARPSSSLGVADAARVRMLSLARPLPALELTDPLTFALPARLCTRLDGLISPELLDHRVVGEMIAWERAAILAGRTMGEWALASALSCFPRGLPAS
jgi:hypothetical protein